MVGMKERNLSRFNPGNARVLLKIVQSWRRVARSGSLGQWGKTAAPSMGGEDFPELALCLGSDADSEAMNFGGMGERSLEVPEMSADLVDGDLSSAAGALLEIKIGQDKERIRFELEHGAECGKETRAAGDGVGDTGREKAVGGEVFLQPLVCGGPVLGGSGDQLGLKKGIVPCELDEAEPGLCSEGVEEFGGFVSDGFHGHTGLCGCMRYGLGDVEHQDNPLCPGLDAHELHGGSFACTGR